MSDKIFGYDWEEIVAWQRGKSPHRIIPPGDTRPRATEKDIKLLEEKGYDWLKEQQFYGIIDRLITSGYLEDDRK